MKQIRILILGSTIILAGCVSAGAQQPQAGSEVKMGGMMRGSGKMMMDMMKMDSNNDGKITKDEFMKSHEAMFDMMKGKDGVIDATSMAKHCDMMHGMMTGSMGKHDNMPQHEMGKPNR
ncbi:hypothetical protein [Noviherbaspirillum suwonense]|uniref:EF hand n=1 Tax=Noviherbaspirillum suwonense TaxID=1224511 RepID=A0ABY1QJ64_9BURK|nr:hypothetical protein [Noviherbaspirillum suwonense]SMP72344.1 EF hand [Noviherbaspirillum suwonense]